jgi:D-alanine-D-alanine ligase
MAPSLKRRRVLVLTHEDLVPPDDLKGLSDEQIMPFKCEYDVATALEHLGHEVRVLGLRDELTPLREVIAEWKPHIAFNLLEEFRGVAAHDASVVSYLELKGVPYTGNSPRGLIIARDKALTKKILQYHRIRAPRFAAFPKGRKIRRPRNLDFPLIVKTQVEESSTGIAQASVVRGDEALAERVAFIHEKFDTAAIAEEYVEGRELYAAVFGNRRLTVLPIWELDFGDLPAGSYRIATYRLKWDLEYQKKHAIKAGPAADLPEELRRRIVRTSRRIFRLLHLGGYARLDFRLREDGQVFLLEANPNPDLSSDEEFASAAEAAGIDYNALVQKMVSLGLSREPGT